MDSVKEMVRFFGGLLLGILIGIPMLILVAKYAVWVAHWMGIPFKE